MYNARQMQSPVCQLYVNWVNELKFMIYHYYTNNSSSSINLLKTYGLFENLWLNSMCVYLGERKVLNVFYC